MTTHTEPGNPGKIIDETPPVDGSGLRYAIPNLLGKDTRIWKVQYGIREDDSAMVFHFSPKLPEWTPHYHMDKRLERAIAATFDVAHVSADYAEELNSFCVIVGGLGASLDPWPLVHRFLDRIDEPLEE